MPRRHPRPSGRRDSQPHPEQGPRQGQRDQRVRRARDALAANPAASATYELPSGTFTVPELTEEIDEYMAAVAEVTAATLAFHAAVEKEKKLRATAFARRAEMKAVVAARIGKHATGMANYGFAPAKVRVVSPKAKLAGAMKAKATRIARGTMGRRQRLAITGNVISVTIAPVTGSAGPASAPDSPGRGPLCPGPGEAEDGRGVGRGSLNSAQRPRLPLPLPHPGRGKAGSGEGGGERRRPSAESH